MILISFGTDKSIFNKESAVAKRVVKYGKSFNEIHFVIFTRRKQNFNRMNLAGNVFIYPTNSRSRLGYILSSLVISFKITRRIIKGGNKDIAVSSQDPFETGFVALILKKIFNLKFLCQVHIDYFSKYFRKESTQCFIQSVIAPIMLRNADAIRVVSQKIRNHLTENMRIKSDSITILPVYVNVSNLINNNPSFSLKERYPQFKKIILSLSRIVKQKNIPVLMRAFEDILKVDKDVGLVIVGSGPESEKIKQSCVERGFQGNVKFEDWTNDPMSYMKSADVFVLSSNYEGWGMVIVEAVACSLPVVMTDVGCANEFIIKNTSGVIVPVNSSKDLSEGICKVLRDDNFASVIVSNAHKRLNELLSDEEEYFEAYYDMFKRMFNQR